MNERLCLNCYKSFFPKRKSPHLNRYCFCSPACKAESQKKDPVAVFWTKIEKTDWCWNWTGSHFGGKGKLPYGSHCVNRKRVLAHRFSYETNVGPIPDGMLVLHSCDNPKCVNPNHLFLGTHQDNADDKISKNRHRSGPEFGAYLKKSRARGERSGSAVLKNEDVLWIRSQGKSGKQFAMECASKFGCCKNTVINVLNRKWWTHI